jgi:glucose-6-phosphate isomerase
VKDTERFTGLGDLADAVSRRLAAFEEQDVIRRIWARDHTVWREDPTEITDRLGWLTVHDAMREHIPRLREFAAKCAADGLRTAVLAGMGGSSLAPEVFRRTFGVTEGGLDLIVLDSTHPEQILAVQQAVDVHRTLFVIASKSGTTTETLSHFAYFWEQIPDGSRFVAITDPGTPLVELATERGFRETFLNPSDIGGRYSALSFFGLVNAALIGTDLEDLLSGAVEMAGACGPGSPAEANPAARLGAVLGEAALAGRDKLTLVIGEQVASFGYWIEQLIAESTGKDGKGILPVEGETLADPKVYGDDRVFVAIGGMGGQELSALEDAGHPIVRIPFAVSTSLGGEMFRWELATAVAGAAIRIHPFDQPDVQSAKDATKKALEQEGDGELDRGDLRELLGNARPGNYLAIQAYLPRSQETEERLQVVRLRLRDRLRVVTTVGFGPRFLHSTGQLHKGGPNTGLFVQVVDEPRQDAPIPGKPYTFGRLIRAQADGDLMALRDRGRRAVRVSLDELEGA